MSDIGTPITSGSIPAVGTAGTSYANSLNLFLTEVKNRLEAKVPKTSILDGLFDMNGYPIANVSYLHLNNGAGSPTTPTNSLQAFGGNLYWVNTGGTVQITSGATLNAASLGGITGDYGGTNPAQWRYVSADQEYYAYANYGTGTWAYVWGRAFDIAAAATGSARVRLSYGGAGSYTLTLPPAAPGAASLLQMDATGAVTASNSLTQAVTSTSTITATEFKHSNPLTLSIQAASSKDPNGSHTAKLSTAGAQIGWTMSSSTTSKITFPIDLPIGSQITGYNTWIQKNTSSGTMAARIYATNVTTTGTETALGAGSTSPSNAAGFYNMTETGLTITMSSGVEYYLVVTGAGNVTPTADSLFSCEIGYKRP